MRLFLQKLGNIIWSALVILSWLALLGGIVFGLLQPPNSIGADTALDLVILTVAAFVLWLLGRLVVWAWCRTVPGHPGAGTIAGLPNPQRRAAAP
jgi:hypothetical protein